MKAEAQRARPRIALATLSETRDDFRAQREHLVREERAAISWMREFAEVCESNDITSVQAAGDFARSLDGLGAAALVIHIPIWSEPVFATRLSQLIPLPVALLGNIRPDTSSLVGMLGAGGALDQAGIAHLRIFDHSEAEARLDMRAFVRAAYARRKLQGQTLGLFGGRSLGIVTATADAAQWQRLFGIDIEQLDQSEIVNRAQLFSPAEVARHREWLARSVGGVHFEGSFGPEALDRQVRSYLATRALAGERGFDFVGVKCQPEMTDGYASQCVAHMLLNGTADADGKKAPFVHACEADADGALTMQILHLLSGAAPAALLDVRWLDRATGVWTLANCGAMPADFAATEDDPTGLGHVQMVPHAFGSAGGGALPLVASPRPVTLARLCRKSGTYWMAVLKGEAQSRNQEDLKSTTAAFPQAFVRTEAGLDFLQEFGSNHIHMASGDLVRELRAFCRLAGIECREWR